MDQLEVG